MNPRSRRHLWSLAVFVFVLPTESQGYELTLHGVVPVGGASVAASGSEIASAGLALAGASANESFQEFAGFLVPESETASDVPELETPPEVSLQTQFHGAAPNPFRFQTTIRFEIGSSVQNGSSTRFEIYDVSGRSVKLLVNEPLAPGRYSYFWDGTDEGDQPVTSGVYFGRFTTAGLTRTIRLIPAN